MKEQLSRLLQHPQIWQAANIQAPQQGLPTGYKRLDNSLSFGGWPPTGLTELLLSTQGLGELQLLGPCLSRLSQQGGFILLISPPHPPYAPAWLAQGVDISKVQLVQPKNMAEQLWAIEQALRCKACAAVLSWTNGYVRHSELRKLQLAAQVNTGLAVIFRPDDAAQQPSPAALRIRLQAQANSLQLNIIKQRGGWSGQAVKLTIRGALFQRQTPVKSWPGYKPFTNETNPAQESLAFCLKNNPASTNIPINWQ